MVTKMLVRDGDEPHTPAWNAKFRIVDGDPGGLFSVTTGSNKQEGIITTAKVGREARTIVQLPSVNLALIHVLSFIPPESRL